MFVLIMDLRNPLSCHSNLDVDPALKTDEKLPIYCVIICVQKWEDEKSTSLHAICMWVAGILYESFMRWKLGQKQRQ